MEKHSFRQWFLATRPWSFPASTMPVLVTVSYIYASRHGDFSDLNWWMSVACLLGVLVFHFGGNLISDYFDYKTGVDRQDNTGQRFLVDGVFEAKTILIYGFVLLAIGSLLGLFIVWKSNINVLYVGLIGLVLTLLYSKFKYHALGDMDVFIIFGVLASAGTSFALLNQLEINALMCAVPVGFLVVAILHSNNTRDREFDGRAKVKTFAMNIGLKASKVYYIALLCAAYLMIIILIISGICHWPSLLVLLSLPIAIKNIITMIHCQKSEDIALLDGKTAQLVLLFSLLLAVSNIITAYIA